MLNRLAARFAFAPIISAVALGIASSSAVAQNLNGTVVDAQTNLGVPVAGVVLMTLAGAHVAASMTDSAGVFLLRAARPGTYRLQVSRVGYAALVTDPISVDYNQTVALTIRIDATAIPLTPLTIVARTRGFLHDATYDGLYARKAVTPPVGSARVFVKGDRDFEAAIKAGDLLRLMKPRRENPSSRGPAPCLPTVYWHGFRVTQPDRARALLEGSVDDLEGVEIYREYTSVPFAYRAELSPRAVRECGVVSLWPRRSDYPKR